MGSTDQKKMAAKKRRKADDSRAGGSYSSMGMFFSQIALLVFCVLIAMMVVWTLRRIQNLESAVTALNRDRSNKPSANAPAKQGTDSEHTASVTAPDGAESGRQRSGLRLPKIFQRRQQTYVDDNSNDDGECNATSCRSTHSVTATPASSLSAPLRNNAQGFQDNTKHAHAPLSRPSAPLEPVSQHAQQQQKDTEFIREARLQNPIYDMTRSRVEPRCRAPSPRNDSLHFVVEKNEEDEHDGTVGALPRHNTQQVDNPAGEGWHDHLYDISHPQPIRPVSAIIHMIEQQEERIVSDVVETVMNNMASILTHSVEPRHKDFITKYDTIVIQEADDDDQHDEQEDNAIEIESDSDQPHCIATILPQDEDEVSVAVAIPTEEECGDATCSRIMISKVSEDVPDETVPVTMGTTDVQCVAEVSEDVVASLETLSTEACETQWTDDAGENVIIGSDVSPMDATPSFDNASEDRPAAELQLPPKDSEEPPSIVAETVEDASTAGPGEFSETMVSMGSTMNLTCDDFTENKNGSEACDVAPAGSSQINVDDTVYVSLEGAQEITKIADVPLSDDSL